jgi:UDP-glucose:glycoprotein glucosyltransferase
LSHSLDRLRSSLLENHDEIEPLKAWEFQELGLQAAQRVAAIQGEEALQILQFTAQNFPTQAKSLLPVVVSDDFKSEMKHNIAVLGRTLNLQPPDAALFVNGLFYDADTLDMPSLMETLRSESRVLDGLHKIGLQGQTVNPLLALELSSSSKDFAIDIRDSSILWINDLENGEFFERVFQDCPHNVVYSQVSIRALLIQ